MVSVLDSTLAVGKKDFSPSISGNPGKESMSLIPSVNPCFFLQLFNDISVIIGLPKNLFRFLLDLGRELFLEQRKNESNVGSI